MTYRIVFFASVSLLAIAIRPAMAAKQWELLPAPEGNPMEVAARVIRSNEQPCPRVIKAERVFDKTIRATCSNQISYRISKLKTAEGKTIELSMNCQAARKLGIDGC